MLPVRRIYGASLSAPCPPTSPCPASPRNATQTRATRRRPDRPVCVCVFSEMTRNTALVQNSSQGGTDCSGHGACTPKPLPPPPSKCTSFASLPLPLASAFPAKRVSNRVQPLCVWQAQLRLPPPPLLRQKRPRLPPPPRLRQSQLPGRGRVPDPNSSSSPKRSSKTVWGRTMSST